MDVSVFRRSMCGVVEEDLLAIDVEQSCAVRFLEIRCGEYFVWCAGRDHAIREKNYVTRNPCLGEVVCGHHDRTATFLLVMDHGIDRSC